MAKILISGGSGLVGKAVTRLLIAEGHEVRWLSRNEGTWNGVKKFRWDPLTGQFDDKCLTGVQHIIHLAGAGIFDKRWSPRYKQLIVDSRVRSSELLYSQVRKNNVALQSFTGASAVGYYGTLIGGAPRKEDEKFGSDFLARVCLAWEHTYAPFRQAGARTTIIRNAVVLDKKSGALPRLAKLFRLGLGAPLGSGRQAFPWIHIDDLARIYVRSCFDPLLSGTYNAAAPEHVSNAEFTAALAQTVNKPAWLPPLPAWALRIFIGEGSSALVTGVDASSAKLVESGFKFRFPQLKNALENLLS